MPHPNFDLTIVGLGPRGHYALECFVTNIAKSGVERDVSILLFEESDHPGNGPIWDTTQPASNWANVHERAIVLPSRPEIRLRSTVIDTFPSFHDWINFHSEQRDSTGPDIYPPRKSIGLYLVERFETLVWPLLQSGCAKMVAQRVVGLSAFADGVSITTANGNSYDTRQVLLTVGHQPTKRDPQIKEWQTTIDGASTPKLFPEPYPVGPITGHLEDMENVTVAIRGFGLASIDVARAIAEKFGHFSTQEKQSGKLRFSLDIDAPPCIVPFSLDGLPMGPKPLNASIDAHFKPSQRQLDGLARLLGDPQKQAKQSDATFLIDALAPIIAEIYSSQANKLGNGPAEPLELEQLITAWIKDPLTDHGCILNSNVPVIEQLNELVGMALGEQPISLDYCIGQVWRHCHPTIYASLSHSALTDEALAHCIFLDETLKRYSFGPPVESALQLIALHEAKVLNLDYLNNPDVTLADHGWCLSNNSEQITASVMVDAVLDSPKIADVDSPLMVNLLQDGVIMQAHDNLGIFTSPDGFVISETSASLPVAVLGRLAKGTIIGVDAILECFGDRPRDWAEAAVSRLDLGG